MIRREFFRRAFGWIGAAVAAPLVPVEKPKLRWMDYASRVSFSGPTAACLDGGYVVPTRFAEDLLKLVADDSWIAGPKVKLAFRRTGHAELAADVPELRVPHDHPERPGDAKLPGVQR